MYSMRRYKEFRTMPTLRKKAPDFTVLPAVAKKILEMKVIGDLTILGMAGGRIGKKLVVAQCKCGRYVMRPPMVIKSSKGQGCTKCRPLV